ncbi:hypothetical protein D9758_008892 [Tetrapyrgos nigripes]|uniref:Uncharacterized protein n=1 Tax=Tetrapyrgos nigripes TaxID=182062 RepID=A0A8H5CLU0_9AGAR|nr:hypothetical protein D9758_008892 [Tetrapyrgos nigripes]
MSSDSPSSNLRERNASNGTSIRESPLGHSSSTSTISETPPGAASSSSSSSARLTRDAPRASLRGLFTPTSGTPISGTPRTPVVRSDPSILTCFDPSDRELYDLWAPKR